MQDHQLTFSHRHLASHRMQRRWLAAHVMWPVWRVWCASAGALLWLAMSGTAHAQGAPRDDDAGRTITAARLNPGETIRLDGSLSHPAWQRAPMWNRFVEKDPRTGAEPPQETRVQLLFDDAALYVGVTALDTQPQLIRDLPVRNDLVNRTQDFVVAYVDAIGSKRAAQFFRVNAAGSMADGIHTASDDSEDFSPDFDWDAAVQRNPQGWTAVMRLPFASLRYAAGAVQNWRFMLARRLPRQDFHLMASVPIPRDVPSFIHNLQPLAGVTLPPSAQFLTLRPSLTVRNSRFKPTGGASTRGQDIDASLDLKWRPTAELVVDGTLNPDFSQVEQDVPQLSGNSRFALFFPEKRPFFFESADLLRTPSEALYTRTYTAPRWGLRGTWRSNTVSGVALLVDDRGGGQVVLPGTYNTDYVEQGASRNLAARVRADSGALSWGGVLATRRYSAQGGFEVGDNTVLGPDVNWQFSDTWRLRGQWLRSDTTALPDGHGVLRRGPAVSGQSRLVKLLRNADFSESNIGIDDIDAGFRHDSGFVNQAGVRKFSAFHSQGWADVGPFNNFFLNVQLERQIDRNSGQLIKEVVRPGWWGTGRSNLEWWLEAYVHSRVRTAAGGPLLSERYVASGLVMTPASWWPLVDTNLSIGRLADASAVQVRNGGRWAFSSRLRPVRALELEPNLSLAWFEHNGKLSYRESTMQLLGVWHFAPGLTLRAISQRKQLERRAEPGVAAEQGASRSDSLTFTWRRSAGTVLYVGASTSRVGQPVLRRADEAFVKLQVDVDEARAMF